MYRQRNPHRDALGGRTFPPVKTAPRAPGDELYGDTLKGHRLRDPVPYMVVRRGEAASEILNQWRLRGRPLRETEKAGVPREPESGRDGPSEAEKFIAGRGWGSSSSALRGRGRGRRRDETPCAAGERAPPALGRGWRRPRVDRRGDRCKGWTWGRPTPFVSRRADSGLDTSTAPPSARTV